VTIRNWREWFVPPEDVASEASELDQARVESGAGHIDDNFKKLSLKRKLPPRCAKCKRWMGFDDGMYIIISGDWRVHVNCFSEVLERHFDNGEVLDLTTGNIVKAEEAD
jgi:hypothetical protein